MFERANENSDLYAREMRQRATLAQIAFDQGDYHAALRNLTTVLSYLERVHDGFSDSERARIQRLAAKIYLGLGMPEKADAAIRIALSLHSSNSELSMDVLSDKRHLSESLRLRKRLDEAEQQYRECITASANAPCYQLEQAKAYMGLGQVLINQNKLAEAEETLGHALSQLETVPKSERFWYGRCLMTLARLRFAQGRTHEAREILEESLGIVEPLIGPDHPLRAKALKGMGRILKVEGDVTVSQEVFAQSERVEQFLRLHDR